MTQEGCIIFIAVTDITVLEDGGGVLSLVRFDRPYATFYSSAIVIIALSCTIFELFTLNDIVTLKSGIEVTQGH